MLIYATQKPCHYLFANCSQVLIILTNYARMNCSMVLQLSEFKYHSCNSQGAHNSSFVNLLTRFPYGECEPSYGDLPCEYIYSTENDECRLAFDGSSSHQRGGT